MIINARTSVIAAAIGLVLWSCVGASERAPSTPAASASQTTPVPKDIDGLLAPIALYPDPLLAQMLMSAGDPESVRRLHDWLNANQALKGSDLQDAAVVAGFEPSFVALAVFPQVVRMMAERLDWTTLVGQVFTADRSAVFASIQKLRAQARDVGTLKSTPQQTVETQKTSSGEEVIVIEPANPQVVYVPQYNPTVVYTQAPPATTTVVVQQDNSAEVAAAGLIGFTAGIAIGAAVNNNYYYGPYGWHGGAYMYNDAWDDYYDAREDAREDWTDHRENLAEERTDRQENRQENRPETQAQREQRRTEAQGQAAQRRSDAQARQGQTATATQARSSGSYEARGYSGDRSQAAAQRSGSGTDAFSGYSSGRSERAASSRGQQSRSSSRSRSGGGRRR